MRVTVRKTRKNKIARGAYKGAIKKTEEALKKGNAKEAQEMLKAAVKALDKASRKGIIKKNTAARRKSKLNKEVKKIVMAKQ